MAKRLFIAINLPEDVKAGLADYSQKWPDLPAKWTNQDNLHITLVFIGDTDEKGIDDIRKAVAEVVKNQKPFSLVLDNISYGPKNIIPPRMVWAKGSSVPGFSLLCDNLNKKLGKVPGVYFKPEKRENIIHITLARIREMEWRRFELDERPEVDEYINFEVPVKSIELMESVLKREGPEYMIIESYNLE